MTKRATRARKPQNQKTKQNFDTKKQAKIKVVADKEVKNNGSKRAKSVQDVCEFILTGSLSEEVAGLAIMGPQFRALTRLSKETSAGVLNPKAPPSRQQQAVDEEHKAMMNDVRTFLESSNGAALLRDEKQSMQSVAEAAVRASIKDDEKSRILMMWKLTGGFKGLRALEQNMK